MAELTGCGARAGVLLAHGPRVVHLTPGPGGGSASQLPLAAGSAAIADVVAVGAAADGASVAAATADKEVVVWVWDEGRWDEQCRRRVPKRPTAVAFGPDGAVVVADKAGEVHRFPRDADAAGGLAAAPEFVLGHVSVVMAVALSADGTRVLTADRDDKVRVSRYPRAWNIDCYCLGHTEFVSSVCVPAAAPCRCVTASGDGTVRLWDTSTGAELCSCEVPGAGIVRAVVASASGAVAAIGDGSPDVHVFELDAGVGALRHAQSLTPSGIPVASVAFAADGALWAVDSLGALQVFARDGGGVFVVATPSEGTLSDLAAALPWLAEANPGRVDLAELAKVHRDTGAEDYFSKKQERVQGGGERAKKSKMDAAAQDTR